MPGVSLRLSTPADYDAAEARTSDLTVLDGSLPRNRLPASPAVLLIDPPSLPGGRVEGRLADSTPSGSDPSNPLLTGVDLTSLDIDAGSARTLVLPDYMTPVAWSPGGPLLAAGDDGSQRVAVLSFDPSESDLPQLASFPVLAANLVQMGHRVGVRIGCSGRALADRCHARRPPVHTDARRPPGGERDAARQGGHAPGGTRRPVHGARDRSRS